MIQHEMPLFTTIAVPNKIKPLNAVTECTVENEGGQTLSSDCKNPAMKLGGKRHSKFDFVSSQKAETMSNFANKPSLQ